MQFIDEATIDVISGAGGRGCVSFRREKYVPRGGPDGGDGGDGGSVVLVGRRSLETLADLAYHHTFRAGSGGHGKGKAMHGRNGESVRIAVPPGTDVRDARTGTLLGEVLRDGQELLVARGGRGGRGNARFVTSTDRAPRRADPGGPAEKRRLLLVLRILADIGLVGFPNVGKSTLLSRLTAARPRIADYPFTTLAPNLGVVEDGARRYTVADLPGIIEGAHAGKGLGLRFLRHIERTRLLLFLIDATSRHPVRDLRDLEAEIRSYNPAILAKPRLLVVNKTDLRPAPRALLRRGAHAVSARTGQGLRALGTVVGRALAG